MKKFVTLLFVCLCGIVSLFAQTNCQPPVSLTAALHYPNWQNVRLNWASAPDATEQTLMWSSSTTLSTRIGISSGPVNLTGAVRFETADLANYNNHSITAVSFIPGEEMSTCSYTIKIWRGGNHSSSYNAGTLVYSKVVTQDLTINSINKVLLDSAVAINPGQELWIGVQCVTTSTAEAYPLGAASGTTVTGKGELLSLGGSWQTLTSGGLSDYNWVIVGTVTENDHIVDGYNVYRDDNRLNSAPVAAYFYLDSVENGSYHYAVTAVYRNGCESDSTSINVTMSDNPCIDCMDSVFICNGNTETYRLPISTYYEYSYNQQIYTAAELSRIDGLINCISFQYFNQVPQNRTMKIYLVNTDKSSFASSSDWMPLNNMTLVYDGTLFLNNEGPNHWLNVPLNQPFEWDGTSNLGLAIWDYTGNLTTLTENTFYAHSASNKSLYYQSYTTPIDPTVSTYSGTLGSIRSNIRFMVGDSITCFAPTNIEITDLTNNSADFSWVSRNETPDFEIVLVPEYSAFEYETPFSVQDTFYSFIGLDENTDYTLYIRSNCNNDNPLWKTISFHTLCTPLATLPYSMNFDGLNLGGGDLLPECWVKNTTLNAKAYVVEDTTLQEGDLYFYSYSGAAAYAVMPSIDESISMNTLQVKFKALKTSNTYGHLEIGVMSNPNDPNTFEVIKSIDASMYSSNNTWYEFIVYLNNYNGAGRCIAFRAPGDYSNYVYVDDIEVDLISGCGAPANFRVAATTGSSAHLAWQPGDLADNSNIYTVEYSLQGLDNWITATTTDNFIILSGLDQLSYYDVKLYVTCSEGNGDTLQTTFLTKCLAGGDINLGDGTSTNSYLPSYSFYNYSYSQQVYLASELNGANEFHSIAFNCASAPTPIRSYQIYLMHTTETSAANNWLPADSAKLVYTGTVTWHTGWNVIDFDSLFHYDGINNLAVLVVDNTGSYTSSNSFYTHTSTSGSSRYVYNDGSAYNIYAMSATGSTTANRNNIILGGICDSVTTCVPPMIVVSNVAPHNAQLTWAPGYDEASWNLDYRAESDPTWTSLGTQTGMNYAFTNLASSTTYQVRMNSICADSNSNYATVSFTTSCDYIDSLPFTENFDSYTTGTSSFPSCWNRLYTASSSYPYISSSYATSGANSLYLYNGGTSYYSLGILPRFDNTIAMDSLLISFQLRSSSVSYLMDFGIMSDPTDASTFTRLQTFQLGTTSAWENIECNTRGYNGNGHYLAFRIAMGTSGTFYLDDLSVDYLPSCMHVENLTISSIDSANATVTWTPGRDESSWQLVVIPTPLPTDSVDLDTCYTYYLSDNYFDLEYLTPATDYTVYVRSDCGDSYGRWESISFQTTRAAAEMPFYCTFEDTPHNWILANGTCANQWVVDTATNNGGTHALYISSDNGASNTYTGSASYVWAYRDIYVPANPDGYVLSFDWRALGESSYDYMNVYFGNPAAPTPGTTLVEPAGAEMIASTLNQSATYQTFSTILPGYNTSGVKRLYFMWRNDASVQNDPPAAVDNVSLEFLSCPAPVNVYAYNVTPESAMINWTEVGNATNWDLYYKTSTASTWTTVNNVTPPYLLTNLVEDVTYTFYVKAVCDEFDHTTSPASFANNFTTPNSCPAPTSIVVTDVTATSFKVNWTAGGSENSWTIAYRVNTASTWTEVTVSTIPYTVTGLDGSTTYNVRVKANCSADDESPWTDYATSIVTSEAPCPTPTNFSATNIQAHSADISWTQEANTASQWKLVYRKTGQDWDTIYVQSPSYSFTNLTSNTRYFVRIYAICTNTTTSTIPLVNNFTTLDDVGINDYAEQNITISPNPTNGQVTISCWPLTIGKVDVYDVYGKLLQIIEVNDSQTVVDLSDYSSGIYFVRINTKEGCFTKRVIKR